MLNAFKLNCAFNLQETRFHVYYWMEEFEYKTVSISSLKFTHKFSFLNFYLLERYQQLPKLLEGNIWLSILFSVKIPVNYAAEILVADN